MIAQDTPLLCYHGSPGTPADFDLLGRELAPRRLIGLVRRGYPRDEEDGAQVLDQGAFSDEAVFCGYSFGALACLRDAAARESGVAGVILISPYIFPKKMGLMKRALVGAPGLGKALLRKKGAQIVEELLLKSSHPREVPAAYRELAARLARPERLARSVQEREEPGLDAREALRRLARKKVPLALLWGAQDQTSSEAEQVAPVRELVPNGLFERRLDNAGHALLWTHPAELAAAIVEFLEQ
jgi:pimeloyl-ACP methyl ester carboxylesterase